MTLIRPHASDQLRPLMINADKLTEYRQYAEKLPKITLTSRENGDLIMLGLGGFTPLYGFMTYQDWLNVCQNMRLTNGVFWPIPITVSVSNTIAKTLHTGDDVALINPKGKTVAILHINSIYQPDKLLEAICVYGTDDLTHPGVAGLMAQFDVNLGGQVDVLDDGGFKAHFGQYALTPKECRDLFSLRGWKKIAAFQTRNPMHRSHEYLVKTVLELFDGVLIHSLFGHLKPGDLPADIRLKAINTLIEHYFVANTVVHSGYPLDMRYAGPKEALLHALFRQNYGCTHLIVGRDHAGVGDFYSPFAAQAIFDMLAPGDLDIRPIKIDWTFYCEKCHSMASAKTCPHDKQYHQLISGTEVRRRLKAKEALPSTFSRPEVVAELYKWIE